MSETTTARVVGALRGRLNDLRAAPALSPAAVLGALRALGGGHPAGDPSAHLQAAIDWLCRAQDAAGDGFARGYATAWNPYFRAEGWQPAYPETTGYIIPTLFAAARRLERPELRERALRAARWEVAVQLADGAVQGGVIGQPPSPAVFNTGQVILGWLSAREETGDAAFGEAARRAGRFLAGCERDGRFVAGNSRFARDDATAYNVRAAWGLAEAGAALGEPALTDAAARVLRATAATQTAEGWFPHCCLYDPERPLLHTLAYTVRGLLEGARVLGDEALLACAARTARRLAERIREDGWMAGRFGRGWSLDASWSCVTGQAQMANNWLRLHALTGDAEWLRPVEPVLTFVKRTQDRAAANDGVRGGIPGSWPPGGAYGRYEMLNWAAKFFADALMRAEAARDGGDAERIVSRLA